MAHIKIICMCFIVQHVWVTLIIFDVFMFMLFLMNNVKDKYYHLYTL